MNNCSKLSLFRISALLFTSLYHWAPVGPLLAVSLNTALLTHSSSVLAHLVCVDLLSLPYLLWAGHWDNWNNPTPTQQITLSKINCLFWPNYHQLAPEVFPLNSNPLVDKVSTLPVRSPYGLADKSYEFILLIQFVGDEHSLDPGCSLRGFI